MTIERLDRKDWTAFFNSMAKGMQSMQVEIEVVGLNIGDQIEADWIPLTGITYETKDNSFDIVTTKLNHRIGNVKEITVDQGVGRLNSIEVVDGDGNHQIIRLKPSLALPEAETV